MGARVDLALGHLNLGRGDLQRAIRPMAKTNSAAHPIPRSICHMIQDRIAEVLLVSV
jgi:hypothetical protein